MGLCTTKQKKNTAYRNITTTQTSEYFTTNGSAQKFRVVVCFEGGAKIIPVYKTHPCSDLAAIAMKKF
jgi:hypothetical protein